MFQTWGGLEAAWSLRLRRSTCLPGHQQVPRMGLGFRAASRPSRVEAERRRDTADLEIYYFPKLSLQTKKILAELRPNIRNKNQRLPSLYKDPLTATIHITRTPSVKKPPFLWISCWAASSSGGSVSFGLWLWEVLGLWVELSTGCASEQRTEETGEKSEVTQGQ